MRPNRHLPTTRVVAVLVAISLGAAACSSGTGVSVTPEENPAASTPAQEAPTAASDAPPASTAETEQGETVDVAGGFLTVTLPPGWEVVGLPMAEIEPTVDNFDDTYTFALDNLQNLATVSNGNLRVFLANEPRFYTASDYSQWYLDVQDEWKGLGVDEPVSTSLDWAGGVGDSLVGIQPEGGFVQIDTVEVDGMYLLSTTLSEGDADDVSDVELEQLQALLAGIVVDRTALSPLAHAVDARNFASAELTGSAGFAASFLVPADWALEDPEGVLFGAPNGDHFIQIGLQLVIGSFEEQIGLEIEDNFDTFFDNPSIRIDDDSGDFLVSVFWDGPKDSATGAVVMASDGVIFLAAYIFAPDPATLADIVDSLVFPTSAFG